MAEIKKIPPTAIFEFRKIEANDPITIPEIAKNRKCTDVIFLGFFIGSMLTMITLTVYSSIDTDYNRFLNGYDSCGDTCGSDNRPLSNINCSGKDLTKYPFIKFKFVSIGNASRKRPQHRILADTCVNECNSSNHLLFHRCVPHYDIPLDRQTNTMITFAEFANDFRGSVIVIIVPSAVTGLVLSLGLYLCFYISPNATVFLILALTVLALFSFSAYVWYGFLDDSSQKVHLYLGIVSAIAIFLICVFICYFYDKYSLAVDMFQEATTPIFKMPKLIFLPLVTTLFICVTIVGMVFLAALISTNQDIKQVEGYPSAREYVVTTLGEAGIVYLVLCIIWLLAFVNGCQCIIVAGPIATYYFQNDKSAVKFSFFESCFILLRYHLGTVAFGSLCITILSIIRIGLNLLKERFKCRRGAKKCLQVVFSFLDGLVEYITKRAYIQTAIHGKPLYQSGKRGARLLWANLMDTVSMDAVGDFIMCCATATIMFLTVGIAVIIRCQLDIELIYFWSIMTIAAGTAGVIVYFFTQVMNVAVETIFLCYCEDKLLNDGKTRPYMMSVQLKTLVEKAKKAAKRNEE